MTALAADLRHALRALGRAPGFAAAAVLSLALGLGATTAVWSALHAVLIRPLPYPEPERLVALEQATRGEPENLSEPNFFDLERQVRSLSAAVAATGWWNPALTGSGEAEQVDGARATAGLFRVLGVQPALGRGFRPEDDDPGAAPVVVVSHGFFRRRLGTDPAALGRTITLNGRPHTVVGVMPEGFRAPLELDAELWACLVPDPENDRTGRYLRGFARLAPGATTATARAELAAVAAGLERDHPDELADFGFELRPLAEVAAGGVRRPLLVLLAGAGLLLAIACANVSSLLLARGMARGRELAVRSALGATPARVASLLMTESLVLAAAGGGCGLLLAVWGADLVMLLGPEALARREIGFGVPVLAAAALATVVSALAAGLAPALGAARTRAAAALSEAGRGATPRRGRLRGALVAAQLAIALTLASAVGLLARSLANLYATEPGIETGALAVSVAIPTASYPDGAAQVAFYERLEERVAALPAVAAAGLVSTVPFSGDYDRTGFGIEGVRYESVADAPVADRYIVSPGYLVASGVRLVAGRRLGAGDAADAPLVVLVDEVFARRHFGGREPLGRRIVLPDGEPRTIVGVVGHVRHDGLGAPENAQLYLPLAQGPTTWQSLVVRPADGRDPRSLLPEVRRLVAELDPRVPVASPATLEELVAASEAERRFVLILLAAFAGIAVATAAIGLYGIVAHGAVARRAELGVRLALGARPAQVMVLVLRQGLALAAAGLAAGLAGAAAAGRLLGGLLWGVAPGDPATIAAVASALVAVALAASWMPARRASRLDPADALRRGAT